MSPLWQLFTSLWPRFLFAIQIILYLKSLGFICLPKPTYAANVHLAIYASTIGASLAFVPKQNLKYNKHTLSMNNLSTFTAVEPFNISLLGSQLDTKDHWVRGIQAFPLMILITHENSVFIGQFPASCYIFSSFQCCQQFIKFANEWNPTSDLWCQK